MDPPKDLALAVAELTERGQARRTRPIVRMMLGLVVVVAGLASLDPNNDPRVTAAVHVPTLIALAVGVAFDLRGSPRAAGWISSLTFWIVVAGSTWFFGGLRFEMGTAYVVSIMIAAATLGSRPALIFGGMSIAAASAVTLADLRGVLPASLAPDSPINGWISVTVSTGIAAALIFVIIRDLNGAVRRAAEVQSERDAAKIRLLRSQRLEPVGRLAGGVAHDFNNLLTVISTVSGLLRETNDDEQREELLDDLDNATVRATQMTGQLLAFSKDRRGEATVLDLGDTVRGLGPILSRLLGDTITLEMELDDAPTPVLAAPGQLEQVVLNLAVNAREALPDGGKITLRCLARDASEVCLYVEDSGIGMDADTMAAAFSPFYTTKPSGTGLGLATVSDIVNACGGRIRVTSEPGTGTRFIILLPMATAEEAAVAGAHAVVSELRRGRVLLVDDHDLVRRSTRQVLERAGFEVTAVADGLEALSLLRVMQNSDRSVDLIVTDLSMPQIGGEELIASLDELDLHCPALVISGNVDALPERLESVNRTVAFLAKPFSRECLLESVERLQRRHAKATKSAR